MPFNTPYPSTFEDVVSVLRRAFHDNRYPEISWVGVIGLRKWDTSEDPVELFIGFRSSEECYDIDDLHNWLRNFIQHRPVKIEWMRNGEPPGQRNNEWAKVYSDRLSLTCLDVDDAFVAVERDLEWSKRNRNVLMHQVNRIEARL